MQKEQTDQDEEQTQGRSPQQGAKDTPYQQAQIPVAGFPVHLREGSAFPHFDMAEVEVMPHGQHVLGSNEEDLMSAFWADPESMPEDFNPPTFGPFGYGVLNTKAGINGHFAADIEFDGNTVTPTHASLQKVSLQKTHGTVHSSGSEAQFTPYTHFDNHSDTQQLSTDDVYAANLINSMKTTLHQHHPLLQPALQPALQPSTHQQPQSQQPFYSTLPHGTFIGSWGNLAMPNTMPQNAAAFGHFHGASSVQTFNNELGPFGNGGYQHPMVPREVQPQDRTQPRPVSGSSPMFLPPHPGQYWSAPEQTSAFQPGDSGIPIRFGTDPKFRDRRYQGTPMMNQQQGKDRNLLGVPFLPEAAALNGQQKVLSHMPANRYPNGAQSRSIAGSNKSSPGDKGSPIPGQIATSWGNMSMRTRHRSDGSQQAESQTHGNEDEEFGFGRGPQVAKADGFDNGASFYASSSKRRKSTNGRAIHSSNSPAGEDSDDGISGSKRKRGPARKKENLTLDQKKANHVKSETKRRDLIIKGLNDISHLIPNLAVGKSGLSKYEALQEIGSYLETITYGTNKLMSLIGMTDEEDTIAAKANESGVVKM